MTINLQAIVVIRAILLCRTERRVRRGAMSCTVASLLTSGCATMTGYPDRAVDVKQELLTVQEFLAPRKIQECEAEKDLTKRQALRNDIVNARIYAIDLHFGEFEQEL